jgi:hypothetical protein
MHGVQPRYAALLLILCMAIPMSGCYAQAAAFAGTGELPPRRQLIIKFTPDSVQCSAADIDKFSAATGTRIQYLRAVSGGACVVSQAAIASRSDSSELEILKNHPAIEWVELDSPLKAQ